MATDTRPSTEASVDASSKGWRPYRLTVRQLMLMIDAGVFPHDADVELLGGILVEKMTKGTPHDFSLGEIAEAFRRKIPDGWIVREDKSLQLNSRSRPEPDLAIVRGPSRQYMKRTPHARETAVVVEVADSTYSYDRGEKWRAYAASRIPVYWIVNIQENRIEVYTDPTGRGRTASYRDSLIFGAEAEIPVVIDGQDSGRFAVKEILP